MRSALLILLISRIAAAQTAASPADRTLTGTILERDPQTASGQFSVRVATNQVFRYRFDEKTTVSRDSQTVDVARLQPGDWVEVISDQPPGAALRYAIAIRVLASNSPPRTERRPLRFSGAADRGTLSGDLSFTGVVLQVSGDRLTLRLRDGREQALTLRQDTSYLADGKRVDAEALKPGARVFVEAGRSIFEQVEAYRVVWGAIMQPK